jgi:hypothetical protein
MFERVNFFLQSFSKLISHFQPVCVRYAVGIINLLESQLARDRPSIESRTNRSRANGLRTSRVGLGKTFCIRGCDLAVYAAIAKILKGQELPAKFLVH